MNNELMVLKNEHFGNVRTTMQDEKVWFIARDIAKALGYADTDKAIRTHCKHAKLLKPAELAGLGIYNSPRGI